MSEVVIGSAIVAHLESAGWDVYQEVELHGPVADIVVVRDVGGGVRRVGVIECKTSLSFGVLAQAWAWRRNADFIWVGTQWARRSDGRRFAEGVVAKYGMGLFVVNDEDSWRSLVVEQVAPQQGSPAERDRLLNALRPEHKTFAKAGSAHGGHFTAFKGTVAALTAIVQETPGITLADAIGKINHHYGSKRSAVNSLAKWISGNRVPGLILIHDQLVPRLYPRKHP